MRKERTRGRGLQGQVEKLMHQGRVDEWAPTLEGQPLAPRQRVLSPIQESQALAQARQWLKEGVIETIPQPELLNNLVLVAKKDGRIRVCVDCTPANKVTKDYDWPLPQLQDLRHFVRGGQLFARLDLKDAFFRIQIPVRYRHLTAFRIGGSAYQFTRMPFGLKTAPSTFQRFMDRGLARYREWAWWYIDDILIKADSPQQLRKREGLIRSQLRNMGCVINEDKSETGKQELLVAGLWVMQKGVGPNLAKARELFNIPPPTNKAEAQSALGLVSYLRDFIPLVSHFTHQLHPDKSGLRLSTEEFAKQWRKLLAHLVTACTINHHWTEGEPADIYTDASQYALGVVVIQAGKIVAVAARKLTPPETRYSATDREHLGLVYAAEKFRLFLHQSKEKVRVWSDHSALLTRKKDRLTPRQARWNETVTNWIPKLEHVKGKDNPADFVSRWKVDTVGANILA